MKNTLFIFILATAALGCRKHELSSKYDYLVGTWKASSSQWCSADSLSSTEFELVFTDDEEVVFRKNGVGSKFDIVSMNYETYSDYKIWYSLVLSNNETLSLETESAAGFEFRTILLNSHRSYFDCAHDSADYRPFVKQQ